MTEWPEQENAAFDRVRRKKADEADFADRKAPRAHGLRDLLGPILRMPTRPGLPRMTMQPDASDYFR